MGEGQRSYWKQVISRGFTDAKHAVGANLAKAVVGTVLTISAAFAFGYITNWTKGEEKVVWYLVSQAIVWVAAVLLFSCWYLIRTPYLLHQESTQELDTRIRDLDTQIEELNNTNAELRKTLERERHSDPQKNILRAHLKEALETFETLLMRLTAVDSLAVHELQQMDRQTASYLHKHFPEFKTYGKTHPGAVTLTTGQQFTAQTITPFIDVCNQRITSLRELLSLIN